MAQPHASNLGKFLRKTSLDEIPQLLNVIKGDMSLIGPRPLLPDDQPQQADVRLMVRPGITGWAQVNGGTELTPKEKGMLDEWYVHNASLLLDLRIIIMTIRYLVIGRDMRSANALSSATHAKYTGRLSDVQSRSAKSARATSPYVLSNRDHDEPLVQNK